MGMFSAFVERFKGTGGGTCGHLTPKYNQGGGLLGALRNANARPYENDVRRINLGAIRNYK